MRLAFETGKVKEIFFYSENGAESVRVSMLPNKCFDVRKFNSQTNYWHGAFESSSTTTWEEVKIWAKNLLK